MAVTVGLTSLVVAVHLVDLARSALADAALLGEFDAAFREATDPGSADAPAESTRRC